MVYHWCLYLALVNFLISGINGETYVAIAHLLSEEVTGSITFTETANGIHVTGSITGLDAEKYGFHIHELGDTSTCDATGAHFNPDGTNHGGPDHSERHVGDLGNVDFVGDVNAVANVDFVDQTIALRGRNNILGRALVLHERADDLGLGGHETSFTTGNAGARVACGVIGIKSPADPWNSATATFPSIIYLTLSFFLLLTF